MRKAFAAAIFSTALTDARFGRDKAPEEVSEVKQQDSGRHTMHMKSVKGPSVNKWDKLRVKDDDTLF